MTTKKEKIKDNRKKIEKLSDKLLLLQEQSRLVEDAEDDVYFVLNRLVDVLDGIDSYKQNEIVNHSYITCNCGALLARVNEQDMKNPNSHFYFCSDVLLGKEDKNVDHVTPFIIKS